MKKILLLFTGVIIALILFSTACKHEALPYVKKVCFTEDVLPLIASNCAMSGCHDANSSEGPVLTDYDHIIKIVSPGNPSLSKLYTVLDNTGENAMPPSGPLTQDQINIIKWWIEQGAENTSDCSSGGCDTANVTYSGIIQPMISTNCGGCHGPGASMGITLTVYNDLKQYLDASKLNFTNAINYAGSKPMPPSGKMPACKISQMEKWINAGYTGN